MTHPGTAPGPEPAQESPPGQSLPGQPLPGQPSLSRLTIGAFRGLRDVRLEELGRINLLVGPNNCGKTSVLEAMAVAANPFDLWRWTSVARGREVAFPGPDRLSVIDAIRWTFPHNPQFSVPEEEHAPICLEARMGDKVRKVQAGCSPIHGIPPKELSPYRREPRRVVEEDDGWLVRVSVADGTEAADTREFPLWHSLGLRLTQRGRDGKISISYLTPYAHRNQPQNLTLLTDAERGGDKDEVDRLMSALDASLVSTVIITTADGQRPLLAVRRRQGDVVPVSVLGDGVRRALSLALAVPQARDGLLLIDEIETALHISALDRVYPWLVAACERFNVQMVATTHSLEVIDALAKQDLAGPRTLAAYHLSGNGESVKRYSGGMLKRLVHEKGLDVR